MKFFGFSPGGQLGDKIEFSKQLTDHLTGIIPLAERIEVGDDPLERIFGLRDRDIGIVLPLPLETPMMFQELFAEELGETGTRGPAERTVET